MGRKTLMNKITSPELLEQVNPKNKELLNDFLDYMASINRSDGSIQGYKSDIEIVWCWCVKYNNNLFFVDWTKRQVVKLQSWLVNEIGNSPARVRRIKASLSSLSNYIENVLDDEYPDFRNIIKKIESPTLTPVREKTVWDDEELDDLLNALTNEGLYEIACFVALGMYSGRRKSELCRFKVSDFKRDKLVCDNSLYKSAPILTKGGKMLECYTLAKKFNPYLHRWLKDRKEQGIESEWLFPSQSDPTKPLPITTVNSWSERLSKMTGRDFYFHSLRHYYCSAMIRAGIPDNIIVDIIGWATSDMLKIYNDNPKDEQIAKYFKNGDIVIPEQKGLEDL